LDVITIFITIFGTQELGIGAISPKMVGQLLEGDKDADLIFTLMGSGLLHLFGPPERLHLGHLPTAHMRTISNTHIFSL
jgi:hypothetical protein